jgi:hypothetical protein
MGGAKKKLRLKINRSIKQGGKLNKNLRFKTLRRRVKKQRRKAAKHLRGGEPAQAKPLTTAIALNILEDAVKKISDEISTENDYNFVEDGFLKGWFKSLKTYAIQDYGTINDEKSYEKILQLFTGESEQTRQIFLFAEKAPDNSKYYELQPKDVLNAQKTKINEILTNINGIIDKSNTEKNDIKQPKVKTQFELLKAQFDDAIKNLQKVQMLNVLQCIILTPPLIDNFAKVADDQVYLFTKEKTVVVEG